MATSSKRGSSAAPTVTAGDMLRVLAETQKTLNGMRAVLEAVGARTVLIKGTKTLRSREKATADGGVVIGPIRIIAPHCQPPDVGTRKGRKRVAKK